MQAACGSTIARCKAITEASHEIRVLNSAGPSENTSPGIGEIAFEFFSTLFKE